MLRIRIIGLALVAVFALSAIAAASASARKHGYYVPGTETAATGFKFKGKQTSAEGELATPKNGAIKCTAATGTGEVTSLEDAKGSVTFTGCTFGGTPCNSAGGKSGEIKLGGLVVLPVLERLATEEQPALLWRPENATNLECTAFQKLTITNTAGTFGGLLVLVASNTFKGTSLSLTFKQSGGKQEGSGEFRLEEGGKIEKAGLTTEGSGLKNFKEESAEATSLTIEFEKEIEIFA